MAHRPDLSSISTFLIEINGYRGHMFTQSESTNSAIEVAPAIAVKFPAFAGTLRPPLVRPSAFVSSGREEREALRYNNILLLCLSKQTNSGRRVPVSCDDPLATGRIGINIVPWSSLNIFTQQHPRTSRNADTQTQKLLAATLTQQQQRGWCTHARMPRIIVQKGKSYKYIY